MIIGVSVLGQLDPVRWLGIKMLPMFRETGGRDCLSLSIKSEFLKPCSLRVGDRFFPAYPGLDRLVSLLSLSAALENLYPSKRVWIVVGNIFQTAFQGLSVACNQGICPLL